MKIVTGVGENAHVTSEEFRRIFEGIIGQGTYILASGENMEPELVSNNLLKIRSGAMCHHGNISSVDVYDEIEITNGTQGMKRIDLLVNRYTKNDETKIEKNEWVCIVGTPSESDPLVPMYTVGNMQEGDLVDDCPFLEIHLDGINVIEVKKLVDTVSHVEELCEKNEVFKPNLLINGDFQVWQRGTSFQTSVLEAYRYNADRWCHYTNVESRLIKKVDNGIYTEANLFQFLEKRLETGVPYVLSARVNGEIYTLPIIGGTQDTSNNRLRYYVGTNFDRIAICFDDATEGISALTINWVKLEKGTMRTPFVPRLYAEELMSCQRYYRILPLANYTGFAGSGGTVWLFIEQLLNMRTTPSCSTDISTVYVVSLGNRLTFQLSAISIEENSVGIMLVSPTEINRPVGVYWDTNKAIRLDAEIYG